MTSDLRPAVEVWTEAEMVACHGAEYAAAAVIEADREAVRAEVVREIVAWLEDHDFGNYLVNGVSSGIADEIEAKFGTPDVAD